MSDTWVLIPLKSLHRGKERLAAVLTEEQRGELIGAMLTDLIRALLTVPIAGERIVLVTEDEAARRVADLYGIVSFKPSPGAVDPLSAALSEAAVHVAAKGAGELLIVHADVPCATADDFHACVSAHQGQHPGATGGKVTLISDRAGEGTNCLVLTPPTAIRFHFGPGSRENHRDACAAAGVSYGELICARLARDIDQPEDLDALLRDNRDDSKPCGAGTRAVVAGWCAKPMSD